MFAKSVFEPIDHCRELNETEERGGEFVVSGVESAMAFDPPPEDLDATSSARWIVFI